MTEHHLFTYLEVRAAVVRMRGEPVTAEEHEAIQKEAMRYWKSLPKIQVSREAHDLLHRTGVKIETR